MWWTPRFEDSKCGRLCPPAATRANPMFHDRMRPGRSRRSNWRKARQKQRHWRLHRHWLPLCMPSPMHALRLPSQSTGRAGWEPSSPNTWHCRMRQVGVPLCSCSLHRTGGAACMRRGCSSSGGTRAPAQGSGLDQNHATPCPEPLLFLCPAAEPGPAPAGRQLPGVDLDGSSHWQSSQLGGVPAPSWLHGMPGLLQLWQTQEVSSTAHAPHHACMLRCSRLPPPLRPPLGRTAADL